MKIREERLFLPVLLILFSGLGIPAKSIAQNYNLQFERVSIAQGLSQSSIQSIVQDELGFIWFGTQDGLNRYDGYHFRIFKHDARDSMSISDDWINVLLSDRKGGLWVGTAGGGLDRYDQASEKFSKIHYADLSGENSGIERINALLFDRNGNLWIGTDGAGVHCIDPNSLKIRYFANRDDFAGTRISCLFRDKSENLFAAVVGRGLIRIIPENGISDTSHTMQREANTVFLNESSTIRSVHQDAKNLIWLGTENGLRIYDPEKKVLNTHRADPENKDSLSSDKIYDIFEDKYGIIWLASDNGISLFHRGRTTFRTFQHNPSEGTSLSNDLVRVIFPENSGTIWIGTYGGGLNVFTWRKSRFALYNNIPGDPNSLNDNTIWSILDQGEFLWIGTNKGLNRLERKHHSNRIYSHDPEDPFSLSDDIIRVIFRDRQGTLWLGTNDGGLNRLNPGLETFKVFKNDPTDSKSISNNTVRCIFEDRDLNLWVGTWGGLNRLDRRTGAFVHYINSPDDSNSISDNRVRCIYQDVNNVLWIGTYGGLNRFDPVSGKFSVFLSDPENPRALSHDRVLAIHGDSEGILWIGTYGGGLNRFDPKSGIFKRFTEKEGLANNAIYGILEDGHNNLWISTNQGLSCFNKQKMTFNNYDANDGLQSNEFNGGAYYRNSKGEMFFGGINGLNSFFPDELTIAKFEPPIRITAFRVFEKEIPLEKSITYTTDLELQRKQNFFSFEFSALDYNNPAKNQYAYMLEGFDQDWVLAGERRYASYTNLDGGEYTFKVRGSNSDGIWSSVPAKINIDIIPPIWQRLSFRLIGGMLVLGLIFGGFRFQIKKIERQKRKLQKEVNFQTEEINERNLDLITAKQQTDTILNNVEEGLFLLNKELQIESQYSRAVETIFKSDDLAGKKFIELLENRIPPVLFTSMAEYLELMIDEKIDEFALADLNPISRVELAHNGGGNVQHLTFKFRRITDQKKISGLIATVSDISDQIRLANDLEASEKKTRKQMEWLVSILHVEAPLLREFIEGVQKELTLIDRSMRNDTKRPFQEVLETVYRSVNTIKGNASLLDLKYFINGAHEFEEKIVQIRNKDKINGNDFVPLILKLGEMKKNLSEINNLIDRISQIRSYFRPKRAYENQLLINSLRNLVKTLSDDLRREVILDDTGFDADVIPYKYHILVKDVLVQMIRNAVKHGIEDPEERLRTGKARTGRIEISSFRSDPSFVIKIRDDGRGIDLEKLKKKVDESGIWEPSQTAGWIEKDLTRAILAPGITTVDEADYISGRGMGLDIVRHMVEENDGILEIDFEAGKYTEFTISFPEMKEDAVYSEIIAENEMLALGDA